jgi:hypothetical protein
MPMPGTFVEVEYMNLMRGGSLYQAVYKGERDDKTEADTYSSLRFKGEAPVALVEVPAVEAVIAEKPLTGAQKAWATRKAKAAGTVPAPKAPKSGSEAARKAWATRRAKAAA